MRGPRSTPSLLLRGTAATTHATAGALRATDPRRRLALLACAGLLVSLGAPWYAQTVTAPGLQGPRRIAVSLSGWQALSLPAIGCAVLALGLAALLLLRAGAVVEGLGARGRRAARGRADGGLVAAGGLLCAMLLLATVADPPAAAVTVAAAHSAATVRWGVAFALVLAIALIALGAAIVRAAAVQERAGRERGRGPSGRRGQSARARPPATGGGPMPEFDFAVGEGAAPPVRRAAPRERRGSSRTPR